MTENSRAALALFLLIAGWALIVYAGYLHYVALPGEHAPRHVITRGAFVVGGICLIASGTALVR